MTFRLSLPIAASPTKVFDFVADFTTMPSVIMQPGPLTSMWRTWLGRSWAIAMFAARSAAS